MGDWIRCRVPGTCGELAQGYMKDANFLITCPVNIYSHVNLRLVKNGGRAHSQSKWKANLALKKTFELYNEEPGFELIIDSDIPTGKGMASSTADIVGVSFAAAWAIGEDISAEQVAKIALSIEPSDGTMFPAISMFDHISGTHHEVLGAPFDIYLVIIDDGGFIDTREFNKIDYTEIRKRNEGLLNTSVNLIREALYEKSYYKLGLGASISAFCNQEILYKEQLEEIDQFSRLFDASGICVAHSGTVIGVIFQPDLKAVNKFIKVLEKKYKNEFIFKVARLVGGGVEKY
ncbi:MAG: GHMP kinase [Actinobacteria bacterium]|nr:GHMP kinase [Actinomycetota bacterium]